MVELNDFAAVKTTNATVFSGSNLDVLPFMADNSVDAIVTDPPYELGFMGKSWDSSGIAYSVELWQECLRVLKPGGHLLAFGGSRTWHRIAVAIEDAGFDVRDSIAWLYGSGFPKSLNIGKAVESTLLNGGSSQKQIRQQAMGDEYVFSDAYGKNQKGYERSLNAPKTIPPEFELTTDEAKKWQGWGTALKPAFEPIVVARKPLVGTVAANVLEWGVGGLNIDVSRIGTETIVNPAGGIPNGANNFVGTDKVRDRSVEPTIAQGRWPANIILDPYTAELLDEQSGQTVSNAGGRSTGRNFGQEADNDFSKDRERTGHSDSGGASRFFYVAKASKRDRNEGLEELPAVMARNYAQDQTTIDTMPFGKLPKQNFHPTVKPTDLMRYLIKLVTPAGGVVLDPFTGSGSTGKAALLDGYQFLGIELTNDYLPIIQGRLEWAEAEAQRVAQAAAEEEESRLF